eukprot:2253914-Rhodomonas_salina.1
MHTRARTHTHTQTNKPTNTHALDASGDGESGEREPEVVAVRDVGPLLEQAWDLHLDLHVLRPAQTPTQIEATRTTHTLTDVSQTTSLGHTATTQTASHTTALGFVVHVHNSGSRRGSKTWKGRRNVGAEAACGI